VTIEAVTDGDDDAGDIHLHAGGQGFWIARLLVELGVPTVLCSAFGGETGKVTRGLIADEDVEVRAVDTVGSNGAYVHDRRSGERVEVAEMPAVSLTRHEVDDLYGATLVEALDADVTVIAGHAGAGVVPDDLFRRLGADLRIHDRTVVADLSGSQLEAALAGGLTVLKVSDEELHRAGRIEGDDDDDASIVAAMRTLVEDDAAHVVVTRAERSALALVDGGVLEVIPPELEPLDSHGAGDSLTAGIAAALARGGDIVDALRFGAAAGALNVTRRGLATGRRAEIERLAEHVDVVDIA
jgi:1-phosphofructokinase